MDAKMILGDLIPFAYDVVMAHVDFFRWTPWTFGIVNALVIGSLLVLLGLTYRFFLLCLIPGLAVLVCVFSPPLHYRFISPPQSQYLLGYIGWEYIYHDIGDSFRAIVAGEVSWGWDGPHDDTRPAIMPADSGDSPVTEDPPPVRPEYRMRFRDTRPVFED